MVNVFINFITDPHIVYYIATYLICGIPFGLLLAKKYANVNIQEAGSNSIGATNVLRVVKEKDPKLAKKLAVITVLFDALKGAIMILIAKAIGFSDAALWLIAIISILGHCFSPYLNFEGGKGVATGAGVLLVLLPIATLISIAIWFICAKFLKISSLSSLVALIAFLIASHILYPTLPNIDSYTPLYIIFFIVIYKHIPNIMRLIKKEEKQVV
ncbi:MAG: glycerol-3-phosphate 1-O-acyltransferase PlsY [Campylobacteraceae bacterium]|jgi:glycerol-3-phosphate acyltransferase PlsY|nr:glycerol-3-phosphate 1-O-acyltransferase PlsY [Campylobacteraceae bacterium]